MELRLKFFGAISVLHFFLFRFNKFKVFQQNFHTFFETLKLSKAHNNIINEQLSISTFSSTVIDIENFASFSSAFIEIY
jgi:hypothetical protein